MKRLITVFLIILTAPILYSQPTQAEIDKMMKQAQDAMNKYGKDSTVKNAMKDAQDKKDQVSAAMKNQQGNTNNVSFSSTADPGSYANVNNWKFPVKNSLLLASLPKKILTKTELSTFLNDSYSLIAKKMEPGIHASVQSLVAKYAKDVTKMGESAVLGWYTDHKEEALLLILKAASLAPENLLVQNNCAALLNLSGLEQKAIPILKYVLQFQPENSMALNNMGQAFAGLGEKDTAMVYLGRCIKIVPEHPEACNTVAHIEAERGNKEKAIEYFEKSIKSAYSRSTELRLSKIKKGSKIANLVRPRIVLPEYFNLFKYDLPFQCTNTGNAISAEAEHNAFRKTIMKQAQAYGAKYAEVMQKKAAESMEIMKSNGIGGVVSKDQFVAQSYYNMCVTMAREVTNEYAAALLELASKTNKDFNAQYELLEKDYQLKYKSLQAAFKIREDQCCGEGKTTDCCPTTEEKCIAFNNLANQYLPKFAELTIDWQTKSVRTHQQYFDELAYWNYLALHPTGDNNFKLSYYGIIANYLTMLGGVAQTKIIKPCEYDPINASRDANKIPDIDCPLDIDIAFVIGAIELNCEKFSIEGGEGLIFKYERDFKSRQSTLSIGIGAKLELGKGVFSFGVEQYAFVKFDGNGRCADAGIKMDVSMQAGKDVGVKGEVGYTLGIESGWDFNEGPFKGMIAPAPEVQLNKNVPVYKPGK